MSVTQLNLKGFKDCSDEVQFSLVVSSNLSTFLKVFATNSISKAESDVSNLRESSLSVLYRKFVMPKQTKLRIRRLESEREW